MNGRLKAVLVVSLVLNVFLIGGVAGALLVRARLAEIAAPPRRGGGLFMRGAMALGEDNRAAFREAMRAKAVEIEPILRDARDARLEAVAEFAKPGFDPPAASAALARARASEGRARGMIEESVIAFAATLEPKDRAALGRSLRRGGLMGGLGRPPRLRPGTAPPPPGS